MDYRKLGREIVRATKESENNQDSRNSRETMAAKAAALNLLWKERAIEMGFQVPEEELTKAEVRTVSMAWQQYLAAGTARQEAADPIDAQTGQPRSQGNRPVRNTTRFTFTEPRSLDDAKQEAFQSIIALKDR